MRGARAGRAQLGRGPVSATVVVAFLLACAHEDGGRATGAATPSDVPAVRVVSLVPAASAILVGLGAADLVVGRAADDPTPAVAGARLVGHALSPSLEDILAWRSDLVVAWAGDDLTRLQDLVSAAGGTVLPVRLERLEDIGPACERIAKAIGRPLEGVRLATSVDEDLDSVQHAVAGETEVGALWVVWPAPTPGTGVPGRIPSVRAGRVVHADPDLFHEVGPHVGAAAAALAVALHPDLEPRLKHMLPTIRGTH